LPVITTDEFTAPLLGDKLLMTGAAVNVAPLLGTPLTVTTTGPVVTPAGAEVVILVAVQLALEMVPTAVPLKVTVLDPWVAPKLVPLMTTAVPAVPETGAMLVMLGVGSTVKLTPLLALPPTVTVALPLIAPLGTGATICVALQLAGVVVLPLLKVTVLDPWVRPKFRPANVID